MPARPLRHPLTQELVLQILAMNEAIAEHAAEPCQLILSWPGTEYTSGHRQGPRVRRPVLQRMLAFVFDDDNACERERDDE